MKISELKDYLRSAEITDTLNEVFTNCFGLWSKVEITV